MTNITIPFIQDRFEAGVLSMPQQWSILLGQAHSLDVVNHVLRVILQLERTQDHIPEFEALRQYQRPDGGWADIVSGKQSGVRNTCFTARNLIRANRILRQDGFKSAVIKAIYFVISQQAQEGFWSDRVWGSWDATGSGVGFMLYARNREFSAESEIRNHAKICLQRAVTYLEHTQAVDGSWGDGSGKEPGIGPTCHIMHKVVLYVGERTPMIDAAIKFVLQSQTRNGSWDNNHTDHTCDAIRALLLIQNIIPDPEISNAIERGVEWLVETTNSDGLWSERPQEQSSLLITCDVLDSFSKYEAFLRSMNLRTFWQ